MRTRRTTDERREQIAEAALSVIAEQGLGRFTTAAIARQVGIAEGTLFRHFQSKEEIVAAAIAWLGDLFAETVPPPGGDPLVRLRAFFRARMALMAARPGVARLLFSDQLAAAAGEESARQVRELQRRSAGFVRECLAEAAATGRLRDGLRVEDLVVLFIGTALALVQHGDVVSDDLPLPERADRVWSTLIRVIEGETTQK